MAGAATLQPHRSMLERKWTHLIAMAPRAFSLLEASKDGPKRKIGEGGKLTVDDLIELRAAGVDAKYIEQMRTAGIGADLSLNDLVALRIQGVTPDYIRGLREAGLEIKSADTAIALRAQGVTPKWLASMKSGSERGPRSRSGRRLIQGSSVIVKRPRLSGLSTPGVGKCTRMDPSKSP